MNDRLVMQVQLDSLLVGKGFLAELLDMMVIALCFARKEGNVERAGCVELKHSIDGSKLQKVIRRLTRKDVQHQEENRQIISRGGRGRERE